MDKHPSFKLVLDFVRNPMWSKERYDSPIDLIVLRLKILTLTYMRYCGDSGEICVVLMLSMESAGAGFCSMRFLFIFRVDVLLEERRTRAHCVSQVYMYAAEFLRIHNQPTALEVPEGAPDGIPTSYQYCTCIQTLLI